MLTKMHPKQATLLADINTAARTSVVTETVAYRL